MDHLIVAGCLLHSFFPDAVRAFIVPLPLRFSLIRVFAIWAFPFAPGVLPGRRFLLSMIWALVPSLLINVYITGLNQVRVVAQWCRAEDLVTLAPARGMIILAAACAWSSRSVVARGIFVLPRARLRDKNCIVPVEHSCEVVEGGMKAPIKAVVINFEDVGARTYLPWHVRLAFPIGLGRSLVAKYTKMLV